MGRVADTVDRWRQRTEPEHAPLVDAALAAVLERLPADRAPSEADLADARAAGAALLTDRLLDDERLDPLLDPSAPAAARQALKLRFTTSAPELLLPPPAAAGRLRALALFMAAVVGAVLGMTALGPLAWLVLGDRAVGLFTGGPLGAGLLVLAVRGIGRRQWLLRAAQASLALGGLWEAWRLVRGTGTLWSRIRGRTGGARVGALKRLIGYLSLLALTLLVRTDESYDRQAYEHVVRAALSTWLEGAERLLAALSADLAGAPDADPAAPLDARVAEAIVRLHQTPREELDAAARLVFQAAGRAGLSLPDGEPFPAGGPARATLTWTDRLKEKYEPFGLVEDGDLVEVSEPCVEQQGRVIRKGVVLKASGGAT